MTEARWIVRAAAVLVGLANLVLLAHFFGGNPALLEGVSWENVSFRDAAPSVLATVVAAFAVSGVTIRRFDVLAAFGRYVFFEKLSHLHSGIVGAVCLGGALMGFMLGALLFLQGSANDVGAVTSIAEQAAVSVLGAIVIGGFGAMFGGALGTIEGLLLAPPLAAILGSPGERPTPPSEA